MELQDRVILITGASGGLGAATARRFAAEGSHVVVTYCHHREDGAEVSRQVEAKGRKSLLVQLDQTDPTSCEAAVEATVTTFGRLDILINNAAVYEPVPLEDLDALTPELWDRVMHTNLRGPLLMTRAAAPHLKQQAAGRVVNIAGLPGVTPTGSIAHAVAKAGLLHLTQCLAVALAPSITVNSVAPGLIEGTRMFVQVPPEAVAALKDQAVLKRTASIEDVVRQIIGFCQADSITGQTQVIDGGVVFH
jgi:3-oxoacyl-[acyl-carrier protein] reductase